MTKVVTKYWSIMFGRYSIANCDENFGRNFPSLILIFLVMIMATSAGDKAHILSKGWMVVYRDHLEAGLRLLIHNLFYDIMNYWGIEIRQIAPMGSA